MRAWEDPRWIVACRQPRRSGLIADGESPDAGDELGTPPGILDLYLQLEAEHGAPAAAELAGMDTAQGFVSRAACGLRARTGAPSAIPLGRVACHWVGPGIGGWPWDHSYCYGLVRGIQSYHMDANGWADIAYSHLPCGHGFVFVGRGAGVRTAANGTNPGNDAFHAACYLGGQGDPLTAEGKAAYRLAFADVGVSSIDATTVSTHRRIMQAAGSSTECPGDEAIVPWVAAGCPVTSAPDPDPDPTPPSEEDDMRIVNVTGTGIFLLTADGPDHINTPDQVLELAAVGIPYAADKELPPATFARFFGRHTVQAAAGSGVDYSELVADVRERLAEAAPEPLGCAAEDG